MGLCASYAAGAICCCAQGAHLLEPEIRRGLFTVEPRATGLQTGVGHYPVNPANLNPNQGLALSLSTALQQRLTELELIAAVNARRHDPAHGTSDGSELLVVDGPVRGREHLPRVLGFIKSHQIAYLEPRLHGMVASLASGERTPVFLIGGSWDRFSWYLRLPGPPSHPGPASPGWSARPTSPPPRWSRWRACPRPCSPGSPRRSSRTPGPRRTSIRWGRWRRSSAADSGTRAWCTGRCDERRARRASPGSGGGPGR